MLYDPIKILHIISATLVFTSMAYSYYLWWTQNTATTTLRIQTQTWLIIIPFAMIQLFTGFTMITLKHYDVSELWVSGSILSFIILISSWLGFIYFLLMAQKIPLDPSLKKERRSILIRAQSIMLFICSVAFLSMIFFMTNKI